MEQFPSPRGDKLCLARNKKSDTANGFRPLAGISCVAAAHRAVKPCTGFRPLAGISCVAGFDTRPPVTQGFRPLAGISCVTGPDYRALAQPGFRPLAGISCVCKTAQLEPVGLGLVLTGSLYHTPLQPASGSWK